MFLAAARAPLVERLERPLLGHVTRTARCSPRRATREWGEPGGARLLLRLLTLAAVRERDRGPRPSMRAGEATACWWEVFIERGREAGIYTYRLDVRRIQGLDLPTVDEPGWRISQQELLTSGRRPPAAATQSREAIPRLRNLIISAEDLEVRIPRGSAFVAEAQGG